MRKEGPSLCDRQKGVWVNDMVRILSQAYNRTFSHMLISFFPLPRFSRQDVQIVVAPLAV